MPRLTQHRLAKGPLGAGVQDTHEGRGVRFPRVAALVELLHLQGAEKPPAAKPRGRSPRLLGATVAGRTVGGHRCSVVLPGTGDQIFWKTTRNLRKS